MTVKQEFIKHVKEHEGIVYKVASVYADGKEDRQDLFQEIIYQLWRSYPTFKGHSKISTWMYRVALNTSITHLKKEKRKDQQVPLDPELLNRMEDRENLEEEQLAILHAHIKKLNLIEKGIILLYLEGRSYVEIAAITGFTQTNIGTRLSRIKQKLKDQITKEHSYGI
ncbi:RNA polymerase sigma factor [Salinimicrobium gaetbulicola]|uniref:RNA polymerase sigma factor n=1 Tax=Salinimicrobium gaetbulicola TaxID=999702 RepID=A0ABW3IDY4_9FLAO